MCRVARTLDRATIATVFIAYLTMTMLVGCNNGSQSATQAMNEAFKNEPGYKKVPLAQFAGKVTVDGQPPQEGYKLFVILNDPKHLDAAAQSLAPGFHTACDAAGNFAFGTNDKADGVAAGKYVLTFVELKNPHALAKEGFAAKIRNQRATHEANFYAPPDQLKNLYNDPDKNAQVPQFQVDLQPPGRSDYEFNLEVAGKETAPPARNAVTKIKAR